MKAININNNAIIVIKHIRTVKNHEATEQGAGMLEFHLGGTSAQWPFLKKEEAMDMFNKLIELLGAE